MLAFCVWYRGVHKVVCWWDLHVTAVFWDSSVFLFISLLLSSLTMTWRVPIPRDAANTTAYRLHDIDLEAKRDADIAELRAERDAAIAKLEAEHDAAIAKLKAERDAVIAKLEAERDAVLLAVQEASLVLK